MMPNWTQYRKCHAAVFALAFYIWHKSLMISWTEIFTCLVSYVQTCVHPSIRPSITSNKHFPSLKGEKKKSTFGRAVVSDTTCHQIFNCFNCNYFFFLMSKDVICVKIEQLSLSFFLVAMMTYLCLVRTKQMLQKEHLPDYCILIICVCVLCVCECDNC